MILKKKINIILDKKQKAQLVLLTFGAIFISLIETVGIGSIGVFVLIISDIESAIATIPENFFIKNYLVTLDYLSIIFLSSILLCFIFLIKNILIFIYHFCELTLRKDIIYTLSVKTYKNYLKANYLFHKDNNPAKLFNNITSKCNKTANFLFLIVSAIKEILLLIFLLTSVLLVNFKISATIFTVMFLISLTIYLFVKLRIKNIGKQTLRLEEETLKNINQGLGGFKIIKILGRFNFFLDKFGVIQNERLNLEIKLRLISLLPKFILEVLSIITISITIYLLLNQNNSLELILPTITFLSLVIIRMLPAFVSLNHGFQNLRHTRVSLDEHSQELLNFVNEIKEEEKKLFTKVDIKNLLLKNVSFKFKNSPQIINNVNFEFIKGDFVGLIGKTGSGKSTIVDLILGLLKPDSGEIYFNGQKISDNYYEARKKIGYIPQEIYLSDESLLNNIAYGVKAEDIDFKKIDDCIIKSQLKNFIDILPNKIDTIVGDRGARISGGQKQRIGIARALYNDASIIVMDESTNSLDEKTENIILEDVKMMFKNKIVISVTHKASTLKFCNKILELKDGNFRLKGNYEDFKKN